jgi:hypothetical protein
MIQEIEKLEKANWLRKARGEDAESVVKRLLAKRGIDPATKTLDTFEDKVKVLLELWLGDIKERTSESDELNNARFFKRYSMLPHVLQKQMLDGVKSGRNSFKERQDLLEQVLSSGREKLPNIQNQLAVVCEAMRELLKTQDFLIAELSRRIVKDDERPKDR